MGFKEEDIWNMAMDRFNLYTKATQRVIGVQRSGVLQDTSVAIGAALGGKDAAKGVEDYVKELTN